MKVILTGSTGFIGREVLKQCLANPEIDSSIVLSRRAIPDLDGNSKARVVVMEDFTEYTPEVLREIDGADASIWCLGSYDDSKVRDIDYPLALFEAIISTPSFKSRTHPFHHVHLSGAVVETDQNKSLWFMSDVRQAKGRAQTAVTEFSSTKPDVKSGMWKAYLVRPGYVLPTTTEGTWLHYFISLIFGPHYSVWKDELAASMVHLAADGGERVVLESKEIGIVGRGLLARR